MKSRTLSSISQLICIDDFLRNYFTCCSSIFSIQRICSQFSDENVRHEKSQYLYQNKEFILASFTQSLEIQLLTRYNYYSCRSIWRDNHQMDNNQLQDDYKVYDVRFDLLCNISSMLQRSSSNSAEFSGLKETDQPSSFSWKTHHRQGW